MDFQEILLKYILFSKCQKERISKRRFCFKKPGGIPSFQEEFQIPYFRCFWLFCLLACLACPHLAWRKFSSGTKPASRASPSGFSDNSSRKQAKEINGNLQKLAIQKQVKGIKLE